MVPRILRYLDLSKVGPARVRLGRDYQTGKPKGGGKGPKKDKNKKDQGKGKAKAQCAKGSEVTEETVAGPATTIAEISALDEE